MKNILLIIAIVFTMSAEAQSTASGKMEDLKPMVGTWEGDGWFMDETRKRTEFTQKEDVSLEIGGNALLIKGKGFNGDDIVHDAMAIISFDSSVEKYDVFSVLADGKRTHAELRVLASGKFEWGFDVQGGFVKYSISIENDLWVEKGAFSPDKENWYPFISFTLNRI